MTETQKWMKPHFKAENQHIQVSTVAVEEILQEAFISLSRAVAKERLTAFRQGVVLGRLKNIEAVLAQIAPKVAEFTTDFVEKSYGMGVGWIDDNLENLGVPGNPPLNAVMKRQLKILSEETFSDIMGRSNKMKEDAVRFLREEFSKSARSGVAEGKTKDRIIRDLTKKLRQKEQEGFEIRDRAGRRWDPKSYSEMAVQTFHARIHREAKLDRLVQRGHQVAQVTTTGSLHSGCARWEGKRVALTAEAASRFGLPLVTDLPQNEIFHPRCHHSIALTFELIQERQEQQRFSKQNKRFKGFEKQGSEILVQDPVKRQNKDES